MERFQGKKKHRDVPVQRASIFSEPVTAWGTEGLTGESIAKKKKGKHLSVKKKGRGEGEKIMGCKVSESKPVGGQ